MLSHFILRLYFANRHPACAGNFGHEYLRSELSAILPGRQNDADPITDKEITQIKKPPVFCGGFSIYAGVLYQ